MSGTIKMEFGVGEKSLRVEDALNKGREGTADGLTVAVTTVNRHGNTLALGLKITRDGNAAELQTFEGESYGIWLVAPDGTRYRANNFSGLMMSHVMMQGGGAVMGHIAVQGGADGPAQAGNVVIQGNGAARTQSDAQVNFFNLPAADGKWTLVYTYPGEKVPKEYPFKLTNVPLR